VGKEAAAGGQDVWCSLGEGSPLNRSFRKGGIRVEQALDQLVPVCFVWCLVDPILQGAMSIDVCRGDSRKEEPDVVDHEVLVVQLRPSD
jgi:hypothetical protein